MKRLKLKKIFISAQTAVIASTLSVSFFSVADVIPWKPIEIETVVIAEPTAKVKGHAPGIETFMLARNNPTKNPSGFGNRLQICDAIKVNYRILDFDADIPDINAIKNSIRWFVQVSEGSDVPNPVVDQRFYLVGANSEQEKNEIFSEIYQDTDGAEINEGGNSPLEDVELQNLTLILYDDIKLRKDRYEDGSLLEGENLRTFVNKRTSEGKSVFVGYEILPYTITGEPEKGNPFVANNQFTGSKILEPNPLPGSDESQNISEGAMPTNVGTLAEKYSKLVDSRLYPLDGLTCEIPPPIKDSPYVIGYYEVTRGADDKIERSHLVDYLVAGKEYRVKFYLDKNMNKRIDIINGDEDLTDELLSDGGKDYLNRPFINGLRLDIALDGFNKNNPNEPSVFEEDKVVGEGANEVRVKGIELDRFTSTRKDLPLRSPNRFFFIDEFENPLTKYLIFRTFEGLQIPEEILNRAPQLLNYYGDGDNAVTLQRFVLNVRSKLPAGFPIDEESQQGGGE